MKITTKNLEQLSKSVGYDPEKIGIAILNAIGYQAQINKSCTSYWVEVKKDNKLLFWYDL